MYAPEWAGGPGENEDKFNAKRMLKGALIYGLLGRSLKRIPENTRNLSSAIKNKNNKNIAISSLKLAPPALLAGSIAYPMMRNEQPKGKQLVKRYVVSSNAAAIPDLVNTMHMIHAAGGLV